MPSDHAFSFLYEYFISVNPGNPFAERQGRMMNIVRNKLQGNSKVQLLDSKLHGHFNAPSDIIDEKSDIHVKNLTALWRNALKEHDVSEPTVLQKELDVSAKLPKLTARSYVKAKRKMKREKATTTVWTKVTKLWRRLKKRKLRNRGRGGN